jgi:hypothetical protein
MSRRKPSPQTTRRRVLVRFLLVFSAVMALLVAAWPLVSPIYTRWVAEAVRLGLRCVEAVQASVVESRGAELWFYRVVGPGQIRPYTWFDAYTFFGLIPLIALFAATPGLSLRRRLGRMSLGMAGLFLTQAAYLVISLRMSYVALGLTQTGLFLTRTLDGWQVMARLVWEAAPLMWWSAMTAGVWADRLRATRDPERDSAVSPCGANVRNVQLAREGRAS